jgi:hypothetical protein
VLLHPLRPQILAAARTPISASELARRLGQPRQRVNYHVRQLARDGFLEAVGQQRKRNMVEQQYLASAHAYVLAPMVLGEAGPASQVLPDDASATQLLTLCTRAQNEMAQLMESAHAAGVRLRTVSLQSEVSFASAEQRATFTRELIGAVNDVVTRYSGAGAGRAFRLLVGCYPIPESSVQTHMGEPGPDGSSSI